MILGLVSANRAEAMAFAGRRRAVTAASGTDPPGAGRALAVTSGTI